MNYLNKLILILLAITIIPMQAQKTKENFSQYFIKAFTTHQQVIEVTITFYKEDRENPTVLDMFSKDEMFIYMGRKVKVFVMTYQDTLNHHYKMVSDEVRSLFYILRKRLEQQGIKLLIQGARRHYYMIRHFKQDFRAVKLVLGKRYDYDTAEIINIFDPENDFSQIATVQEQEEYFNQWVESITGVKYDGNKRVSE
ncbi:hypothetical protein [Capnocytophaga leadbetteri]